MISDTMNHKETSLSKDSAASFTGSHLILGAAEGSEFLESLFSHFLKLFLFKTVK